MSNGLLAEQTSWSVKTPSPSPHLKLFFLGAPRALITNCQEARFTIDNSLILLAYLALNPQKIHRRDKLAGLLYPDHDEKQGAVNLRQVLLRLRRTLGEETVDIPYFLSSQVNLQFNPSSEFWLDALEFIELVNSVKQHRHRRLDVCRECMTKLERAIDLYQGEFLGDLQFYQSQPLQNWLENTRTDLHKKTEWALKNLASYHFQHQQYEKSQVYAGILKQMDPTNEDMLRLEMKILAIQGNRNQALLHYHEFQVNLFNELNVTLEPESMQLAQNIRNLLPLTSLQVHKQRKDTLLTQQKLPATAMPNTLTAFCGRQAELKQITRYLSDQDCRLMTLVGPEGIGKTRLAMRAAAQDALAWTDGAWLAILAEESPKTSLEETLMKVFGLHYDPTIQRRHLVYNFLRDKEILLVLDHFDQIIQQANAVRELLDQAPRLKIMVTASQRLGIQGEQIVTVPGLDFPAPETLTAFSAGDLLNPPVDYGALQLFTENAQKNDPGFMIDAQNQQAVIRICQQLNGLPLGIELAAAWVNLLSCQEISTRLEQDLDFLTTRNSDVPIRHTSLRAVFENSWKLLSAEERLALEKLSTSQHGFGPGINVDPLGIEIHILARLIDKSWLTEFSEHHLGIHPHLLPYLAEKRLLNSKK